MKWDVTVVRCLEWHPATKFDRVPVECTAGIRMVAMRSVPRRTAKRYLIAFNQSELSNPTGHWARATESVKLGAEGTPSREEAAL